MEYDERTLRVNGLSMNVVIAGSGPDVLLLHGFPDSHVTWREQIPALVAAGYRVIAPDLRGCGNTDMPSRVSDYRMDLLVEDVASLLDVLGIASVRLIAHDWGAAIAWVFAIRHPERVDRYVALSVGHLTCYARGGLMQKLRGYYILFFQLRGIAEWLLKLGGWRLVRLFTGYPAEMPHWKADKGRAGRLTAAINYYRANLGLIIPREWGNVSVPVFGIWSSGDRFLVEKQMKNSERYCKAGWKYARIDGANHWLQLDVPEKLNPLLIDYLR